MVKMFALIPRRPDVTEAFFHEYWASPHGELAKNITTMRGYVQSHRIAPGVAGLHAAIYEGIAEVWFDDAATAAGMGEDPDYLEHVQPDEPNFIDLDNLGFLLSAEDIQREGPSVGQQDEGTKAMLLLRRTAALTPAQFARSVVGVPFAELVPAAQRVSVSVALPDMYADGAEPTFDAVVELWFTTTDAFTGAWGDGGPVLAALDGIADRARCAGFLADELRVIWPKAVAASA